MIDITPLCMAVMALAAVVITLYLVPWIKSKTTKEQRESINALVKIAVQAAEQIFAGAGRGERAGDRQCRNGYFAGGKEEAAGRGHPEHRWPAPHGGQPPGV